MAAKDEQISDELLRELDDHARVLGVFDESQDIALDLHEQPFNPQTRARTLAFLQSPRYQQTAERLNAHEETA